eukprot:5175658-Amphidinium_carterae.1
MVSQYEVCLGITKVNSLATHDWGTCPARLDQRSTEQLWMFLIRLLKVVVALTLACSEPWSMRTVLSGYVSLLAAAILEYRMLACLK